MVTLLDVVVDRGILEQIIQYLESSFRFVLVASVARDSYYTHLMRIREFRADAWSLRNYEEVLIERRQAEIEEREVTWWIRYDAWRQQRRQRDEDTDLESTSTANRAVRRWRRRHERIYMLTEESTDEELISESS